MRLFSQNGEAGAEEDAEEYRYRIYEIRACSLSDCLQLFAAIFVGFGVVVVVSFIFSCSASDLLPE